MKENNTILNAAKTQEHENMKYYKGIMYDIINDLKLIRTICYLNKTCIVEAMNSKPSLKIGSVTTMYYPV